MRAALGILLALLAVEGLLLIAWPGSFRAVIGETSDRTLRIIGLVEILLVLVLLVFACGIF